MAPHPVAEQEARQEPEDPDGPGVGVEEEKDGHGQDDEERLHAHRPAIAPTPTVSREEEGDEPKPQSQAAQDVGQVMDPQVEPGEADEGDEDGRQPAQEPGAVGQSQGRPKRWRSPARGPRGNPGLVSWMRRRTPSAGLGREGEPLLEDAVEAHGDQENQGHLAGVPPVGQPVEGGQEQRVGELVS